MIISCSDTQQDTVQGKKIIQPDSVALEPVSADIFKPIRLKDSVYSKFTETSTPALSDYNDTTSVCLRNFIADVTFFDPENVVVKIESVPSGSFPFLFIEKTNMLETKERAMLEKHLKPGQDLPAQPLHEDWIIGIILITAILYSLIRTGSKSLFSGVNRFFLLRGINDPSSREIYGLFHWQSTILNLISFLTIALFTYFAASYYELLPEGTGGVFFWLIFLGIIITAVTLRHFVCVLTGSISGEKEVYREYLIGVYHSYRYSALIFFVLVILLSYTAIFPDKMIFISGIITFGIMYLIRIIRLIIIFINRNLSLFYLILYLCALEILPVLISVKYFSGLV